MLVIEKMIRHVYIYLLEFYALCITHILHKIYIEKQEKGKDLQDIRKDNNKKVRILHYIRRDIHVHP